MIRFVKVSVGNLYSGNEIFPVAIMLCILKTVPEGPTKLQILEVCRVIRWFILLIRYSIYKKI